MKKSHILLSAFGALFVACTFGQVEAGAVTRYVPSQYSTIMSAIRAAQNGDTIMVAPGVYRETIVIDGKYITLQASSTNPGDTTLAGDPGKTLVMIQNVPLRAGVPRASVKGFKITGGYSPDGQGGGITIAYNADPVIEYNLIEHNHSQSHGGGILVSFNSHPIIKNNQIRNNTAKTFGGGIFAVRSSSPTITGNQITNNGVSGNYSIPNGGSSGGGIYLENEPDPAKKSTPVVYNNNISSNSAEFAGGGIMLRVGVNTIIQKNTIDNNAAAYGGGIHVETEGSSPVIAQNTVTNNTAAYNSTFGGSGYGGGISVYASSKPLIEANTISSNKASHGGAGVVMSENSNSTLRRNTVASNQVTVTSSTYAGGGLYVTNAQATLTNNLIRNNSASLGGGIGLLDSATVSVSYNTIANNQASWSSGSARGGGGLFVRNQSAVSATFTNNIFAMNSGFQIFEEVSKATFTNNLITNHNEGLYYNYNTGAITSASTLDNSAAANASATRDGDPLFVDTAAGNYKLSSGSPAIDYATSSVGIAEDMAFSSRPSGVANDLGAHEYNPAAPKTPTYRFWSDMYRSHFYTASADEVAGLLLNHSPSEWRYEYLAYSSYVAAQSDTVPLYRFWSPIYKGHFYTADSNEKTYIETNRAGTWQYEGVAFQVYPSDYSTGNTSLVYRFWSPSYSHHFYTANSAEKDHVIATYPSSVWSYEGARYRVPQ